MPNLLDAPAPFVTPQLSQQLLRELPQRFFGGLPNTLQELLQNAVRAGANNVTFTLDGLRLTVQDDGPGLSDPQILMTAGESGWDEHVVNPAGLGALSVLNPDFAVSVTYSSQGWSLTLNPEQFTSGAHLSVLRVPQQPGFRIEVQLHPDRLSPTRLNDILTQRRGYAPLNVTVNDVVIAPKERLGTLLSTTVGPLWYRPYRYPGPKLTAVWETFEVNGEHLRDWMGRSDRLVKAFLDNHIVVWDTDPASNARPKLPEREQLIDNAPLHAAAEALRLAVRAEIKRHYANRIDLTQASFKESDFSGPLIALGVETLRVYLHEAGFRQSDLSNPGEINAEIGSGDDETSIYGMEIAWINTHRQAVQFADGDAGVLGMNLLAKQGFAVPWGSQDRDLSASVQRSSAPHVFFRNHDSWNDGHVLASLSDEVFVNDAPVPFAVNVTTEDGVRHLLVLRGPPEAAETYLRAHSDELGGLLLMAVFNWNGLSGGCFGGDDDSDEISAPEVGKALLRHLISAFFPDRAAAAQRAENLGTSNAALSEVIRHMNLALSAQPDAVDPTWPDIIRERLKRNAAAIAALKAEHHLA